MDVVADLQAEIPQPWQSRMGGLRHGALYVEMEDRLCSTGTLFRQAPPTRAAPAGVVDTEGLHGRTVSIGRLVTLEVVKEYLPIACKVMSLEILSRE